MKKTVFILKNILAFLFWMLLMLSFSNGYIAILTVSCALLHELGHILSLLIMKKGFYLPDFVVSGMRLKSLSPLSYKEEIYASFAGPAFNILLFLMFLNCYKLFAIINLITGISNLLPLPNYDGYKIIQNIFLILCDSDTADRFMRGLGIFVSSLCVFVSLFLILKMNGGYPIFFIFFAVFLREIFFFQNRAKNEYNRANESI